MNMRYGLAACGVIAALAVSVAGCSSGGSSTPGSGTTPNTSGGASGTASAAAAPSGGASPSWAAALGSGVTVAAPVSVSAGLGSPEAVVTGDVDDIQAGQFQADCAYVVPTDQSECKSSVASAEASVGPSALASDVGTEKNFAIGYTVIDGDKALVGTTGTFCSDSSGSPSCFTNSDPAAIFSTGKSFATLWSEANNSTSNGYSLAPCLEVGGKWYLDDQS